MPPKQTPTTHVPEDKKVQKKKAVKADPKAGEAEGGSKVGAKAGAKAVVQEALVDENVIVVETEVVVHDPKDVSNGDKIISVLMEKVAAINGEIKSFHASLRQLVKEFDKQKKFIDKVQKKRDKAKKSPSGFAKPSKISPELCDFIGVPHGSEQSRTDITRFINSYVKEHNLNNPENRREIFPDKKLKAVLNVKEGDKVSYFILQRLIAHHFPPSMSKLAAAAAAGAK